MSINEKYALTLFTVGLLLFFVGSTFPITIFVPEQPEICETNPAENSVVEFCNEISAHVKDRLYGVKRVVIYVYSADTPWESLEWGDAVLMSGDMKDGVWTYTLKTPITFPGCYAFTVTAVNNETYDASKSVRFYVKTSPEQLPVQPPKQLPEPPQTLSQKEERFKLPRLNVLQTAGLISVIMGVVLMFKGKSLNR